MLIAVSTQGAAALGGSTDVVPYSVDPKNCSSPQLDRELQFALCEADDVAFSNRIRRSWESRDMAERKRAVEILERVWRLDPTLGHGLPLKALDRDDFRVVVVEFLGQAVRGGLSKVRLWDLQKFATHFARAHRSDERTATAVSIVGVSDAVAELQFVMDTIRTNAGGARSSAINALGSMCPAEATEYLVSVQNDDAKFSETDRRLAGLALNYRKQGAPEQWCKRPQEPITHL